MSRQLTRSCDLMGVQWRPSVLVERAAMGRAWDLETLRRQREKPYPLTTEQVRLPCLVGRSDCPNFTGLRTLGTLGDLEFHLLVLFEAAEASAVDLGVVHEDVRALRLRDEAETFFGVEPLHGSLCHLFLLCQRSRSAPCGPPADDRRLVLACPARRKRRPHQVSARACVEHEHLEFRLPAYYAIC